MFERRLSIIEVEKLLGEGKSQSEIARILGFSKQAVSKALKKKREGGGKGEDSGTLPYKPPLDPGGLRLLKKLMAPVFDEIKALNSEIGQLQDLKSEERKNLNMQRLKYLAEGRKQLQCAYEFEKERYSIEETKKFENWVLEELKKLDEQTQKEFLDGLRRRQAIRLAINKG